MTELLTKSAPSMAASAKLRSSFWERKQLSSTTIELSTIMPIPTTSPPSDMMFMVIPVADMITSVAKTESGIEAATISAARQSPRKRKSTSMASARP